MPFAAVPRCSLLFKSVRFGRLYGQPAVCSNCARTMNDPQYGGGLKQPADGPTGPIVFSDETARRQLIEEGEVVTFRADQRTTGDTWWRKSRTGEKEGDVRVLEIPTVATVDTYGSLADYWELSGFESVEAWIEAIRELNGDVERGRLYYVTEGHDA